MSFAGVEYLPFLGLLLLAWPFVPRAARVPAMLIASYVCFAWHVPAHAILLFLSTLLDYAVGLALGRVQAPRGRKALLWTSLALNLGALGVFKYAGFAVENLNALLGAAGRAPIAFEGFLLPLGISFYTFQTLSYTLDVYARRIEPCRRFDLFALYVAFFPQLVAGPIERAAHLMPQLARLGHLTAGGLSAGGRLILWGLLKKWVCADRLLAHVHPVFLSPQTAHPLELVLAAVGMTAFLYLDFSAYTDLARGSARLFGVELVKNFDRTFLATSIYAWARRWHMSLVAWMTDYVWVPLVGYTVTLGRLWRANLLVMGLFGLWHGASWPFVMWGLGYGVAISVQQTARFVSGRRKRRRGAPAPWSRPLRAVLGWLATVLLAAQFIMVFFSPTLAFAGRYLAGELDWTRPWPGAWAGTTALALAGLFAVHAAAGLCDLERAWRRIGWLGRIAVCAAGVWLLVVARVPAEGFVYFRF